MKQNREYWSERWQQGATGWDMRQASPPLIGFMQQYGRPEAQVLIPGCGNAYEADWLLAHGYTHLTLLDIAPEPVAVLQERYAGSPGIEIVCGDFFKHSGQYDFIIEQTFFCALEKNRREEYAAKMLQLLAGNGRLAGLLFDKEFENNPPF